MGLPVPADMDGRVLAEAFAEGYMVAYPLQIMEPSSPSGDVDELEYTQEGEKEIMERLQQFCTPWVWRCPANWTDRS